VTTQLLSLASVVLLAVVASLAATGAWGDWLGIAASARPNLAAGVALTIFALTVPVSLGYRVLLGLEKNHVIVLAQALVSFGTLAMVVVLVVVRAPLWSLCATPMFSAWLVNAAACVYVRRELDMPWRALANIPRPYLPRLKSVFAIAIPMAMTVSALPIGLQTDRIVLVHVANIGEVARYSAGAQLFGACYSLLSFGGQSLWPVFARLRTEGLPGAGRRSLVGAMRSFAIGGGVLAVGLVVLGPWVSSLTTAGEAPASYGTMAAFGALLLAFALYWPVGMYCTDAPGLRLQAMATWGMAAANLPLSIIFARTWGAAGPALASAVTIVVFMCLPIGWRAWIASGAQLVATAADN
jgi:O-antigen/teichoic acid export membrane protein